MLRQRLRTSTDMGHSAINRRLDEVKSVLQRFQHFEQGTRPVKAALRS